MEKSVSKLSDRKIKNIIKENVTGYLLILPLLIGLTIFTIYPLLVSLYNSFFLDYDGFSPYSEFKFGFGNYIKAFSGYESKVFAKSLRITFSYTAIMVPLGLVVSFLLALFLNQNVKGMRVFRLIYYIPCLIPGIVCGMVYRAIFEPSYGIMNTFFKAMGLPKSKFFDSNNYTAVLTYMFMTMFGVGGSMLMWIAGLRSISPSYYEAAKLEGCGYWRTIARITVPMMGPYVFYQLITNVIGTLQICDMAYMISSSGGVNNNLLFYGLYIYKQFAGNNFGYASALAYLLFIIIACLSAILFRFNKFVYYEGEA